MASFANTVNKQSSLFNGLVYYLIVPKSIISQSHFYSNKRIISQ